MTINKNIPEWTPREVTRLIWAYTEGGTPAAIDAVPRHNESAIRTKIVELRRAGHDLVAGSTRKSEPITLGRIPSVFHLGSHIGCRIS